MSNQENSNEKEAAEVGGSIEINLEGLSPSEARKLRIEASSLIEKARVKARVPATPQPASPRPVSDKAAQHETRELPNHPLPTYVNELSLAWPASSKARNSGAT